jgi:hydroxymethylglutaryl-CoA synthase
VQAADWEFACKAGTEAVVAAMGLVGSQMGPLRPGHRHGYRPGAPREMPWNTPPVRAALLTCSARLQESLAVIEGSYSYVTDTPDFWRREYQKYPEHGQRFTGEPAYFKHVTEAAQALMDANGTTPTDYRYAVFHQPNTKFPQKVAASLGFQQRADSLPACWWAVIGNTYAGAAMIGLAGILDVAKPGDRVLMVSFGSGAGSDAFSITVTEHIEATARPGPQDR